MGALRDKYRDYVTALLTPPAPRSPRAAKIVWTLETKIAKAQASLVDSQNIHKANNLWPMADFAKKAPGLDWSAYFKAAGLGDQKQIDAWQPGAITSLALVASQPLPAWKTLLRFHTLDHNAACCQRQYAELAVRVLRAHPAGHTAAAAALEAGGGGHQYRSRRRRGPDLREAVLPGLVQGRRRDDGEEHRRAFDERIDTLGWMTRPPRPRRTRSWTR